MLSISSYISYMDTHKYPVKWLSEVTVMHVELGSSSYKYKFRAALPLSLLPQPCHYSSLTTVLPAPASYYQFYSSIVLHLSTVLQSYISLQFYSSLQLLLVTIMNTSSYLIVVTFYSTSIVPTPSRFPTPPTYHHYYYDQTTPLSSSYSFRSQWKRNHTAYPTPTTYLLPQLRLLLRQLLLVTLNFTPSSSHSETQKTVKHRRQKKKSPWVKTSYVIQSSHL